MPATDDALSDALDLDALGQADLIRRGEVSPSELVEAAIARIERRNPSLNAVIHPLFEKARAAARGLLPDGPLRGVPFLLKDIVCHSAGDPFHCGMRALRDSQWHEREDTWLAQRFRQAGLVLVGKTNTPELATSITCEPMAYGATHNPWSLRHTPGGSSGGAAAAVASGMVAVAHANDMGGSIRIPASACGLVGLKPSRGRTTLGPDLAELWGLLTHEHVVTRSVRDCAAVLDAIAGPGVGDPYTAPPPNASFLSSAQPGHAGRLRVGLYSSGAHAECGRAVRRTGELLEALGHAVTPSHPTALDNPPDTSLFGAIVASEVDRLSERIGRRIELNELEPPNALLAEWGRSVTAVRWIRDQEREARWARAVASWWEHHDLLVTPTLPNPPFLLGELDPATRDPIHVLRGVGEQVRFTSPFNQTGQPAISLPLHRTADNLPVGVQLVAAFGREDLLLGVAAALEEAAPWPTIAPR